MLACNDSQRLLETFESSHFQRAVVSPEQEEMTVSIQWDRWAPPQRSSTPPRVLGERQ